MKRIWIAGCSGSGKTTLANLIGEKLNIPVYHRDSISWDENDNERTEDEQIALVKDLTQNNVWIFEGARFTSSKTDGRLDRCDTIIHLDLNRFLCLIRTSKRGRQKSKRTDILERDKQPFNYTVLKYIMFEYPHKHKQREEIFEQARKKGTNVLILKTRKDVSNFLVNLSSL